MLQKYVGNVSILRNSFDQELPGQGYSSMLADLVKNFLTKITWTFLYENKIETYFKCMIEIGN